VFSFLHVVYNNRKRHKKIEFNINDLINYSRHHYTENPIIPMNDVKHNTEKRLEDTTPIVDPDVKPFSTDPSSESSSDSSSDSDSSESISSDSSTG